MLRIAKSVLKVVNLFSTASLQIIFKQYVQCVYQNDSKILSMIQHHSYCIICAH